MSFTPEPFSWSPEMDAYFISGDFFDQPVPREKEYLLKYFDTKIQRQFVRYFLLFRSARNFTDHTGLFVQPIWLRRLRRKLTALEDLHRKAKADFNTALVAMIESGQCRPRYRHGTYQLPRMAPEANGVITTDQTHAGHRAGELPADRLTVHAFHAEAVGTQGQRKGFGEEEAEAP